MRHRSAAERLLFLLSALGTVLTFAVVVLFAVTGSGLASDLLRSVAGAVLGVATVQLLTRSPRRGRRVAAVLLLASVAGILVFLLAQVASLYVSPSAAFGEGGGWVGFFLSLLSWAAGASLARLMGVHPLGPRGDQTSRRRV